MTSFQVLLEILAESSGEDEGLQCIHRGSLTVLCIFMRIERIARGFGGFYFICSGVEHVNVSMNRRISQHTLGFSNREPQNVVHFSEMSRFDHAIGLIQH
jgi:hypothetical protein